MDSRTITFGLFSLVGIFTLCYAFDENSGLDIEVFCNHTGIISSIYLDVPFEGVVYARGSFYNPSCRNEVELVPSLTRIPLYLPANDCGTVIQEVGDDMYISNFIVIQKYRFAETVWDIVQNVSCKIPPPETSNMDELIEDRKHAYYHSDGLEAWMEVRSGADVFSGQEVNKLGVGDEISMVVHLKDGGQNKDIRVHKCWAFDGETFGESKYIIELYDFYKCEESEWMSNFNMTAGMPNVSDTLTYATMKAFKFPSTVNLHFTCAIEICSNDCFTYCEEGETERNNREIPRKLHKRAIRSIGLPAGNPLPVRWSVFPIEVTTVSSSEQAYIDRINYMKATIKAMGSKLMKVRESKFENDSSFLRRISGTTMPTKSSRVLKKPSINYKVLVQDDNSSLSENVTEVFVQTWNVVYFFNLSHTVVVDSTREFTFRREMFNLSHILKNCVSKLRFILITVMLVFLIFCLALLCMALAISLRREKKRHKIDNFLLYNYY